MKQKIVLYNPKSTPFSQRTRIAPLALLSISKLLDRKKFDIKIIIDNYYENALGNLLKECSNALCLGITALTGYQIIDGLHVSKILKEKYPKLKIIWGGCHTTILPRQTAENELVDIVVKGQGERTFSELADALSAKKSLKKIPGIVYKENGMIIENPDRPFEDINNFPRMPYELLENLEDYITEYSSPNADSKRAIPYISSYGCPYRCGFCCEHAVSKRRWVGLKPEKVIEEVEWLVKNHNVDGLILYDNNFFVDKERIRKICQLIIKKNLKVNWFNGDGRAREILKFDNELWELMKKAGMRMILIGAESGLQEALDLMQKDLTVEETIQITKKATEKKIILSFGFMVGLPWSSDLKKTRGKTDEELKATLAIIDQIIKIDPVHTISLFIYAPYYSTPLYAKSLKAGFKDPEKLEDWGKIVFDKVSTPWISKEQVLKVYMFKYFMFFLYPGAKENLEQKFKKQNIFLRLVFKPLFFLFYAACKFRWKFKIFAVPIDYWIYRQSRKFFKVNELYEEQEIE